MNKYAVEGLPGYPNELAHMLDDALEQNAELLDALKDSRDLIITLWSNIDEDSVEKRTLGKAFDIASQAIAKAESDAP